METLILMALAVATAYIWSRMDKLERRIGHLLEQLDEVRRTQFHPSTADAPETSPATNSDAAEEAEPVAASVAPSKVAPEELPATPLEKSPEASPVASSKLEQTEQADPMQAAESVAYESAADEVEVLEVPPRSSFDFEDIFGRRLPIWGGGFALAIAGIFLVRFSIEAGLLTPMVRVSLSFLFGLGLLAGAEAAFRFEDRLRDPRVRQALAGAGLATLYGAFYLAGTAYGLIGSGLAFGGLAIVTASAIALSFRFGMPSVVIGLIGGFAAPLLVDSDSANVPLLSFYLALITGGLAWSGQAQGRNWLGYAALTAGLGWGALMMFSGVSSTSDFAALGLYLIVLGTVLPAFLHAKGGPSVPKLAAGAIATLQMAVLVSDAGFAPLTWGLYLLIGAALAVLGWRYPVLRLGTLVAAGLGLWLLVIWPDPDEQIYALVAVSLVAIFAGVPLALKWFGRAGSLDLGQLSAVVFVMAFAIYGRFGSWGELSPEPVLAACMAGLAIAPGLAFAILWTRNEVGKTRGALIVLAPAALLVFAALLLMTPAWMAPLMAGLVALVLVGCYWKRDATALVISAWTGAAITIAALVVTPDFLAEFERLGGSADSADMWQALLRWVATALPFLGMAYISRSVISQRVGEVLSVGLLYGVIAQLAPGSLLAWIASLAAIALFVRLRSRIAAWTTALAIAGLWVVGPVGEWLVAGIGAMVGSPFLSDFAIDPLNLLLRLLPFGAVLAVIVWKEREGRIELRAFALLGLAVLAGVAAHSLYKQIWDISSLLRFEHYGMGERTIWQALLLAAAYGASQYLQPNLRKIVTLGLIAASLGHFVWFTLVLHNPLMVMQYVGPTPVANWLTLAYLTAIAGLWLGLSQWDDRPKLLQLGVDSATMLLISLLSFSLLRQIFAGSAMVTGAINQTESLLISLLGIVLALGFLWWGSWRNERSWRIGSLVLILIAVIKVFLIDAAGLEGLLRIASFMALGFSLIGIGWVYSRQLSRRDAIVDES